LRHNKKKRQEKIIIKKEKRIEKLINKNKPEVRVSS